MSHLRDHGGGIDAAVARWGGVRHDWLDLSTGINPVAYPLPAFSADDWTALPDKASLTALEQAARRFWKAPDTVAVLAAPGASALIARIPTLGPAARVKIAGATYNEHEAAFRGAGWQVVRDGDADAMVVVHPNNPDGALWTDAEPTKGAFRLRVIDESFCDVAPAATLIEQACAPGTIVLKSFGKFWGLAGARLGFAFGLPQSVAPLAEALGPWAVPGPVLRLGKIALDDLPWAAATRARLKSDASKLDAVMQAAGAVVAGGTDLFRLYDVGDAVAWRDHLARYRILTRIFPYSGKWLRLGLPADAADWARLQTALADFK